MVGSCLRDEATVYCMYDVDRQSDNEGCASNEGIDLPGSFSLPLCSGADARHADHFVQFSRMVRCIHGICF